MVDSIMLSLDLINSHSLVTDPGPECPLVSLLNNQKDNLWLCPEDCGTLHCLFYLDLALGCCGRLCVFRWVPIVLLLLQIWFCFVIRETSCWLFLTIFKLVLLRLSTLLQHIWMTYWTSIILILNKWLVRRDCVEGCILMLGSFLDLPMADGMAATGHIRASILWWLSL